MKYYELVPEENTFYTLLADVTHRCNMRCANCYIPNRTIPDMDAEKLEKFVKRLPNRTDIRLIGAESTLRKDLPELIRMIRKHGHRPTLLTNGLKLADLDYCRELWGAGLKSFGLSMNGGVDDEAYKVVDNGKFANLKIAALDNSIRMGFVVHINCILVPGLNEKAPRDLLNLVIQTARKYGKKIGPRYPLMLRFKNVGQIGRYMEMSSYEIEELLSLLSAVFEVPKEEIKQRNKIDGFDECNAYLFSAPTEVGEVYVKVTDWRVDDDGVPDSGSRRRGRITQDFKIAPFFEHVKRNENGY